MVEERLLPGVYLSLGFVVDATASCAHVEDEVLSDEDRARLQIWFEGEMLKRDGRAVPGAARELARWARYDAGTRSGCSNCTAFPVCGGGCPWEYERLGREHYGECDPFRFHPGELVRLAHLRSRVLADA